jgi:hypothetical protein
MFEIAGGILLALCLVVVGTLAIVNWRLMLAAAAVLFVLVAIVAPLAR